MLVRDSGLIVNLATIAADLHTRPNDSVTDLHIKELLIEWLARDWPGTELKEHHLSQSNVLVRRVRDELVREYEFDVCLVNERYFVKRTEAHAHGNEWPANEEQARRSIARGSMGSAGLHFHTEADDLVWEAYMLSETKAGAKKYAKNVNAVLTALDAGRVTLTSGGRIIRAGQRLVVIENPGLANKAIDMADESDEAQLEIEDGR